MECCGEAWGLYWLWWLYCFSGSQSLWGWWWGWLWLSGWWGWGWPRLMKIKRMRRRMRIIIIVITCCLGLQAMRNSWRAWFPSSADKIFLKFRKAELPSFEEKNISNFGKSFSEENIWVWMKVMENIYGATLDKHWNTYRMQANNTKWIKSNWNKHEIQRYLKEYDVKIMKYIMKW